MFKATQEIADIRSDIDELEKKVIALNERLYACEVHFPVISNYTDEDVLDMRYYINSRSPTADSVSISLKTRTPVDAEIVRVIEFVQIAHGTGVNLKSYLTDLQSWVRCVSMRKSAIRALEKLPGCRFGDLPKDEQIRKAREIDPIGARQFQPKA